MDSPLSEEPVPWLPRHLPNTFNANPRGAQKGLASVIASLNAALIAGTTEPLSWLWRRPVTKSPGLSRPLLDRYRARRMDLYRLGTFHRALLIMRSFSLQACILAPEMRLKHA